MIWRTSAVVQYLVGSGEGVVVQGREVAGPGVEHLDHLGAAFDLEVGVQADVVRQLGQHGVQHLGLVVGERFDLLVLHTGSALHLEKRPSQVLLVTRISNHAL